MMTIQQTIADLKEQRRQLHERAVNQARDFTDDEQRQWDRLGADLDRALDAPLPQKTFANTPLLKGMPGYNEVQALRRGETPGGVELSDGGFSSAGEILGALHTMARGGGRDVRLAAISTGNTGGYAIPEQFIVQAFDNALEDTILLKACTHVPMTEREATAPGFDDLSHASSSPYGIAWAPVGENESFGTAQALTLNRVNLTANKHGAIFNVSNEWLADAHPTMRNRVTEIFNASLRHYVESQLWNGIGAAYPIGALNAASVLEIDAETGQAPDTIVVENITKMWSRLLPGSHGRAIWVANQTCFPQLASLSLTMGAGGTAVGLVQPYAGAGIGDAPSGSIFSRPLYLSEHLRELGLAGDIALLDPTKYLFGDRRQVIVDVSPHSRFEYDETQFRASARFDGGAAFRSTFTPENGDSCSWCVTLAAR